MTAEIIPPVVEDLPPEIPPSVPVDQEPDPRPTAFDRITAAREGRKQPLVVPWLREREQRAPILRWAAGYGWHVALFHLLRLPVYQLRLTRLAPRGMWRGGRGGGGRGADDEGPPPLAATVVRGGVGEDPRLAEED